MEFFLLLFDLDYKACDNKVVISLFTVGPVAAFPSIKSLLSVTGTIDVQLRLCRGFRSWQGYYWNTEGIPEKEGVATVEAGEMIKPCKRSRNESATNPHSHIEQKMDLSSYGLTGKQGPVLLLTSSHLAGCLPCLRPLGWYKREIKIPVKDCSKSNLLVIP